MTKKFGQNFLISRQARERIADLIASSGPSLVWEIGPGIGAITSLLLKRDITLRAFEIDHGFCQILTAQAFGDEPRFTLVEGDALKTLFAQRDVPSIVCGNLPYNVGSQCIARLIENGMLPDRMVFTLQKEVVERMCASPSSPSWSSFSVLTQLDYENRMAFTIPRGSFYPSPNVDSALVVMDKRREPLVEADLRPVFLDTVRALFAQRRKTVRNNLAGAGYSRQRIDDVLSAVHLSGQERAETFDFATLRAIAVALRD